MSADEEFRGRLVVVTGATRGIGLAAARRFASLGARVAVTSRSREAAERTAGALGSGAIGLALELEAAQSCQALAEALRPLGPVQALVNNAGVFPRGTVAGMSEAGWSQALEVNLTGTFRVVQKLLPIMARPGGCIVNLVSGLAVTGGYASGAYAASKAGLMALTRTLGIELGPEGLRANALSPGVVDTDLLNEGYTEEERTRILSGMPGRKAGSPEDVAGSIVYLASRASFPMSGQTVFLRTPVGLGAPPR